MAKNIRGSEVIEGMGDGCSLSETGGVASSSWWQAKIPHVLANTKIANFANFRITPHNTIAIPDTISDRLLPKRVQKFLLRLKPTEITLGYYGVSE
ncbi:MAG: hypothetical protein AB4290_02790 [Spirulina sp.]